MEHFISAMVQFIEANGNTTKKTGLEFTNGQIMNTTKAIGCKALKLAKVSLYLQTAPTTKANSKKTNGMDKESTNGTTNKIIKACGSIIRKQA